MERFYKEQVETWRGDLELKHAQFEEARAQIMQPRELDTLRKQLMEEIETPARAKLRVRDGDRGRPAVHASRARLGDAAHGARRRGGAFA